MATNKHLTTIEEGLDFILSHFPNEEPKWPRKISTRTTGDRQILVNTSAEALARFKAANYLDCKINAYRRREDWAIKLLGQAPQNIFIDLDEHDFKSKRAFELAVHRTLKNFKEKIHNAFPTIIHSGNLYNP